MALHPFLGHKAWTNLHKAWDHLESGSSNHTPPYCMYTHPLFLVSRRSNKIISKLSIMIYHSPGSYTQGYFFIMLGICSSSPAFFQFRSASSRCHQNMLPQLVLGLLCQNLRMVDLPGASHAWKSVDRNLNNMKNSTDHSVYQKLKI